MFELTIFVPLTSNEGAVFSAEHHGVFESRLAETFGGFSRLPGMVEGGWIDGGVTYRDQNLQYLVCIKSISEGSKVVAIVELAKRHYCQLAIYVRYLGVSEIL